MDKLVEIIEHKRLEIAERKSLYPAKLLERSIFFDTPTVSLRAYLAREDLLGIIAEIKRRSPSRGDINPNISVKDLSIGYMQAGASALSVLTDSKYFGGSLDDLRSARSWNFCPILRKDFIVDEYQIIEARSAGADVVLLIAAALTDEELKNLGTFARSLGLETLVEVHSKEELERSLYAEPSLIGVNSRDLRTLKVDLNQFLELGSMIPDSIPRVAESGISSAETLRVLRASGYRGFLIGEHFMRNARPERACEEFVRHARMLNAH